MGVDGAVGHQTKVLDESSDLTDIIGGNGRWQREIFLLFFVAALPCCWHNMAMTFFAPKVQHWCANPYSSDNMSTDEWKERAIPKDRRLEDGSELDFSQCYRYESITNFTEDWTKNETKKELVLATRESNATTVGCQKWEYDDSFYQNTVVSQWDLVCDKAWMISLTNSVFMAGFLTSVLFLGQLADKIGRKPVIIASVIILVAACVISAFSISFIMFTVTRFFIALGASGIYNTGFVMLMEVVAADYRSVYGISINFGWSSGYLILALMAWLIRDWFWLQITLTVPCLALFAIWWLVPESPRWLLTQGKTEKAQKILFRAAEKNKKETQDLESTLKKIWSKTDKNQYQDEKKGNILDLFVTNGLWQRTLNLYFCWFVNSFIYYGLSFNTNDLMGNPMLNFALTGLVEFPAYLISIFVIKSLGRRIPLMVTMVVGGLACLLTVPLTNDMKWVVVPLALFGKFCISASFAIVYVYSAEIFPTVLRNTGVGTCSMCARIGSILAPFVKELGLLTYTTAPLACFGLLSVASGLFVLLLPETNCAKVPDSVKEAADFGRKKKAISSDEKTNGSISVCIVHDGIDKVKPSSPVNTKKPVSDGKKLPDLLEEPSVVDEALEEVNNSVPIIVDETEAPVAAEPSNLLLESVELKEALLMDNTCEFQENDAISFSSNVDNGCSQQTPL